MKQNSTRSEAAQKARMRRLRAQYRRRTIVVGVILFILGVVAGIFAHRWYDSRKPNDAVTDPAAVQAAATLQPEASEPDEDWLEDIDDIFPEDEGEPEEAAAAEQNAFPEVDAADEGEDMIFPEDEDETAVEAAPEQAAPAEGETAAEAAPAEGEAAAEAAPAEGETAAEAAPAEGEAAAEAAPAEGEAAVEGAPAEGEAAAETAPAEGEAAAEAAPAEGEAAVEGAPAEAAPAEGEAAVEAAPAGPQVVAIVPFGESFTYATQVKADGTARVEVTDEPYETVSFTQTMKSFMRPTDFANKYSTQYKLQGNEAGAGFELILNDYTGETTIVPQNVIDVSLRSESGETVERGYQLMDAEIAGNYGVALATNTPKMFYKRYQYSTVGEEMAYLVITTYNDGVSQMILFQLESDEPEPTPEPVYNILQKGVTGDDVARMQQRLIELGYLTGVADGSFGGMTEEAIRKAQEAFGLEVNGIADNAFQQKLYDGAEVPATAEESESAESAPASYVTLKNGSTGEAVVNLQLRLRELGYYEGKADGGYGALSEDAVRRAQTAFGMEVNGIADEAFQRRLFEGEGSADAGEAQEAPAAEATPAPETVAGENTVG